MKCTADHKSQPGRNDLSVLTIGGDFQDRSAFACHVVLRSAFAIQQPSLVVRHAAETEVQIPILVDRDTRRVVACLARDELLHVIPGRHYGFPFRHPGYLPSVVDEPEVVGFSPQHQSACGFRFNELRSHRQPFGPAHWEGNAMVTGFSRGKLWRVPLAKSRAGYVGKHVQFAAFESLPTDVAVSPTGDLLVTCHGGRPIPGMRLSTAD